VTRRHTCGGQQARGTFDYTDPFYVDRGTGHDPVSSPGDRNVRCPYGGDVDCTVCSPSSLGPFHDRPSSPYVGLERDPSPVPSLSPPFLSLVSTTTAVAPVSDSIIIESPGVEVPLDYVPTGIYQDRHVWSVPVVEEGHDGQENDP